MLHLFISSLEALLLSSSAWSEWGSCHCRDGSLWGREGSAAWSPGGVLRLAGPFVGGMFAFLHLLSRWWLNLACLFQQPAFHQKQPGWEMNSFVWSWMKYFAQPTDWGKKRRKIKAQQIELRWTKLFFPLNFLVRLPHWKINYFRSSTSVTPIYRNSSHTIWEQISPAVTLALTSRKASVDELFGKNKSLEKKAWHSPIMNNKQQVLEWLVTVSTLCEITTDWNFLA